MRASVDSGILFMFHCRENTGYAIASLESVFLDSALAAGYALTQIHVSYQSLSDTQEDPLHCRFLHKLEYDYSVNDPTQFQALAQHIRQHQVRKVVAFDLGIANPLSRRLRRLGIETIIAYWGAPLSPLNRGVKLLAKKLEVALRFGKPDRFIFESRAMALTATHGRGLSPSRVVVVPLGVDITRFTPAALHPGYLHDSLGIDRTRKIVLYSGHMEPRKGVSVILRAAVELVHERHRTDVHFVLCGDAEQDLARLRPLYEGTRAGGHVTFAGYRTDMELVMASSYLGVIASTGWDSFTMSSIEMAASGLPLVVSDLQGLSETVDPSRTGYTFEPGNHIALADTLEKLLADQALRDRLGVAARDRATREFSRVQQVQRMARVLTEEPPWPGF
jgi:glycosyltransferase involved in cell wall biosynthesis